MLLGNNIGPVVLYCRKPVEGRFNGGGWESMCANDGNQYCALAMRVTYQCIPFTSHRASCFPLLCTIVTAHLSLPSRCIFMNCSSWLPSIGLAHNIGFSPGATEYSQIPVLLFFSFIDHSPLHSPTHCLPSLILPVCLIHHSPVSIITRPDTPSYHSATMNRWVN